MVRLAIVEQSGFEIAWFDVLDDQCGDPNRDMATVLFRPRKELITLIWESGSQIGV
jgi:hypothetical protein